MEHDTGQWEMEAWAVQAACSAMQVAWQPLVPVGSLSEQPPEQLADEASHIAWRHAVSSHAMHSGRVAGGPGSGAGLPPLGGVRDGEITQLARKKAVTTTSSGRIGVLRASSMNRCLHYDPRVLPRFPSLSSLAVSKSVHN